VKRIETELEGVCILEPEVHGDDRGCFFEAYNKRVVETLGLIPEFVQDNESSSRRGVLRGLHYQVGNPQAKLVRVVSGEVFDVAVDIRVGSPTFAKWTGTTLSDENKRMLYIPEGFAHGFYVLSESAVSIYKCSDYYSPASERGIIWNDLDIGIDWHLMGDGPILSDRDAGLGTLMTRPSDDLFQYDGACG
jgi:dTDP-4-dehydrorhamnose 3,5-epimerase